MDSGTAPLSPIDESSLFTIPDTQDDVDIFSIPDSEVNYSALEVSPAHRKSLHKDLSDLPAASSSSTGVNLFAIPDSPTSKLVSPSTELDLFYIPDTPKSSPIPTEDVQHTTFPFSSQHDADLDLYRIPDSPNIPPLDRTDNRIPDSPIVLSHVIPTGQDPIQLLETANFMISDSQLSPMADLMEICEIPNSPILEAVVHPEIPDPAVEAGPSIVDTQLQGNNTTDRLSLKTIGRNLIPYLPVILSRASLLRAQLAQLITEKEFIKGQIDEAVTRIAEVDRYLYGLRALQLVRQEGCRDEEAGM